MTPGAAAQQPPPRASTSSTSSTATHPTAAPTAAGPLRGNGRSSGTTSPRSATGQGATGQGGADRGATGQGGADRGATGRGAAGRHATSHATSDRDAVLDHEAAERVLRRAVQLDGEDSDVGHRVSVQALLDAADELGIDRAEVRRAVVEEELGLLEATPRRSDVLLGPDRFVVARVLEGSPEDVSDRIDQWMRRGRVLRRSRTQRAGGSSGWVEYTRRTDPVAGAQRALRSAQGHERLAHARKVRVVVSALDDRRCVAGLVVDASRSRTNAAAGGTAVALTGTAGSLAGFAAVAEGWLALTVGVAAGAAASVGAGAGVMWGRKAYTANVADELESVLDAVESGERPLSMIEGVTSRLQRPTRPTRP